MSAQVLGSLSFLDTPDVNGSLVLTTATGVAAGNISGTAGVITVTGTTSPVIDIADNPIFSGTAGMVLPAGTTAQRGSPTAGTIRQNTTLNVGELFTQNAWVPLGRTIQSISGNISTTTGTGNKTTTSIPLVTEGIAIWSQVLTPTVIGSAVTVQFSVTISHANAGRQFFVAVFQGNTCIGMSAGYSTTAASLVTIPVQCVFTTTSLAPITFSARAGTLNGTNAIFVNKSSGSATYGNALQTEYRLIELLP